MDLLPLFANDVEFPGWVKWVAGGGALALAGALGLFWKQIVGGLTMLWDSNSKRKAEERKAKDDADHQQESRALQGAYQLLTEKSKDIDLLRAELRETRQEVRTNREEHRKEAEVWREAHEKCLISEAQLRTRVDYLEDALTRQQIPFRKAGDEGSRVHEVLPPEKGDRR